MESANGRRKLLRISAAVGAIVVAGALLPGVASADAGGGGASPWGPGGGARHGSAVHDGGSRLGVRGRAISRSGNDTWGLEIGGERRGDDSRGGVRFMHRAADQSDGFEGEITCLRQDPSGVVEASGIIRRSRTRTYPHVPGLGGNGGDQGASAASADPSPGNPGDPGIGPGPGERDPGRAGPFRNGDGGLAGKAFGFTIDVPGNPQHFSRPAISDKVQCSGGTGSLPVTRGGFQTTRSQGRRW